MTAAVPRRRPPGPADWDEARARAHEAGSVLPLEAVEEPLHRADGRVLARDVVALCDLPPFDASMVDGYAVGGPGPWRIVGWVPAGIVPEPLAEPGTGVRIAGGAMVPQGTEAIVRLEDADREDADREGQGLGRGALDGAGLVRGTPRERPERRTRGETARQGAVLVPAGTVVTPGVIGVAAAAGHDTLSVYPRPRLALVVVGDGLVSSGLPGAGRIRDTLGPQLPGWAERLGFEVTAVIGPVPEEPEACTKALRRALAVGADLLVTAGGSGHGPQDPLREALAALGAERLIDSVRARPGKPLRLALLPGAQDGPGRAVPAVGLPGNPQPAILGLLLLAVPAAAGLTRRPLPPLGTVTLGGAVPARGGAARMALCRLDADGHAVPVRRPEAADAAGFAVLAPGAAGVAGERVPFLPLPLPLPALLPSSLPLLSSQSSFPAR